MGKGREKKREKMVVIGQKMQEQKMARNRSRRLIPPSGPRKILWLVSARTPPYLLFMSQEDKFTGFPTVAVTCVEPYCHLSIQEIKGLLKSSSGESRYILYGRKRLIFFNETQAAILLWSRPLFFTEPMIFAGFICI